MRSPPYGSRLFIASDILDFSVSQPHSGSSTMPLEFWLHADVPIFHPTQHVQTALRRATACCEPLEVLPQGQCQKVV
jgi:hypothetical protein